MGYATNDLVLAIVHHLLVFTLAGILAIEIGTVSLTMKRDEILRVGRVDNWYGILAGVIVVIGFIRAGVALKSNSAFAPPADAIRRVRAYLWAEAALFLLLLVFAAVMARGYGELTP